MSKEIVCDVCGDICSPWKDGGKVSVPLRYKIWSSITGGRDLQERDLCTDCRMKLDAIMSKADIEDVRELFDLVDRARENDAQIVMDRDEEQNREAYLAMGNVEAVEEDPRDG